jgi:NAD kinase
MYEKIVVVTRRTRLEELIDRFNTRGQAKFYIEHAGGDFADYEREHDAYRRSFEEVRRAVDVGLPRQLLDRGLVPTYTFAGSDVVLVLGQDGLVANTAKYAGNQPIIAVNPDPARFDGILLPFLPSQARAALDRVLGGTAISRGVTLAEVALGDGQRLLAFNDVFLGAQSHVSARYRLRIGERQEVQSSSGVLVSTGAGSTGWMSSVFNMAAGVSRFVGGQGAPGLQLEWEDRRLIFAVREPFVSRHSSADLVAGLIQPSQEMVLESLMPSGGVIFSDGIEADYLQFSAGTVARIRAAAQRANLVVGATTPHRVRFAIHEPHRELASA